MPSITGKLRRNRRLAGLPLQLPKKETLLTALGAPPAAQAKLALARAEHPELKTAPQGLSVAGTFPIKFY